MTTPTDSLFSSNWHPHGLGLAGGAAAGAMQGGRRGNPPARSRRPTWCAGCGRSRCWTKRRSGSS
ncbi:hypothetical protein LCGC14_2326200, partial [marine sediment metagenome]